MGLLKNKAAVVSSAVTVYLMESYAMAAGSDLLQDGILKTGMKVVAAFAALAIVLKMIESLTSGDLGSVVKLGVGLALIILLALKYDTIIGYFGSF